MERFLLKLYYFLAISISAIFLLIATAAVLLQSSWGRAKIETLIAENSSFEQFSLNFKDLRGFLPFQWKLSDVEIQIDEKTITAETVSFRIDLFRLISKTIAFKSFSAEKVRFIGFENNKSEPLTKIDLAIPVTIYAKSFDIKELEMPNTSLILDLRGKGRLQKGGNYLLLDVKAKRSGFKNSQVRLALRAEKQRLVNLRLWAHIKSLNVLSPYITSPVDARLSSKLIASASWEDFEKLLLKKEGSLIHGSFNGSIKNIESDFPSIAQELIKSNLSFVSDFTISSTREIELHSFHLGNDFLALALDATISSLFEIEKCAYSIFIDNLSKLPFQKSTPTPSLMDEASLDGSLEITGELHQENQTFLSDLLVNIEDLNVSGVTFEKTSAKIQANMQKDYLGADLSLNTSHLDVPWTLTSNFEWTPQTTYAFKNLRLENPDLSVRGNIDINTHGLLYGEIFANFNDLSILETYFPDFIFDGFGAVQASFSSEIKENRFLQNVSVDLDLNDITYDLVHANHVSALISFEDLFGEMLWDIDFFSSVLNYKKIAFETLNLKSSNESENWPFAIVARGNPIGFDASGFWNYKNQEVMVDLQDLVGSLYSNPFHLPEPTLFTYDQQNVALTDTLISMEQSSLQASFGLSKDLSNVSLDLKHFPIDFLSLNPLDLSVSGFVTANLNLETINQNPTRGNFHLALEQAHVLEVQDLETPESTIRETRVQGVIDGSIENNKLSFDTKVFLSDKPFLLTKANLSVSVDLFPFNFQIIEKEQIDAIFDYDGKIEDLINFFDVGPNRISGDLLCHVEIQNTLKNPNLTGSCSIKNGRYENYFSGTYLQEIEANLNLEKKTIDLLHFQATGKSGGELKLTGQFEFDIAKKFPFSLGAELEDLQVVELDFVSAEASGKGKIEGNFDGALVTGNFTIPLAEFTIPDKIPSAPPSLNPTFIHQRKKERREELVYLPKKIFPLQFDVSLNAPNNIFARGKGLNSEWQGNFKLEGSITELLGKGELSLLKGDFIFSGHAFDLTEGQLTFTGRANELPFIQLSAQTSIRGITIVAKLQGPINQPDLAFNSMPALPLSSILSYLLFGNDISEITTMQAVQLAATAASLSGGDFLESTRKTLQVDRLAVISTPGADGEEDFAVQLGKYVTKGVLVSVSRGREQGSSNVAVELDLSHGFIFQAETIQQQEQGRFSLKWNRNF